MDHAVGVGVGHRLADLLEDPQAPRPGRRRTPSASARELRKGPALDQLHREVRAVVGEGAQLVDRHDARVLELAGDLRLLDEAADHLGAVAEVVAEDLDGQVAPRSGSRPRSTTPMPPRPISPRSCTRTSRSAGAASREKQG